MSLPRTGCAAPEASRPEDDCRCRCGSLVARIVAGGVEIKCRRCKRDLLVPWNAGAGWTRPIECGEGVARIERGEAVARIERGEAVAHAIAVRGGTP